MIDTPIKPDCTLFRTVKFICPAQIRRLGGSEGADTDSASDSATDSGIDSETDSGSDSGAAQISTQEATQKPTQERRRYRRRKRLRNRLRSRLKHRLKGRSQRGSAGTNVRIFSPSFIHLFVENKTCNTHMQQGCQRSTQACRKMP